MANRWYNKLMTITQHARCTDCGFESDDIQLVRNHSCDIELQGGTCEDYPACGHEWGDCNGRLYGSDEHIKAQVAEDFRNGHGSCDHENGFYDCEDMGDDYEDEEDRVLGLGD
jgi:hypothetical protein